MLSSAGAAGHFVIIRVDNDGKPAVLERSGEWSCCLRKKSMNAFMLR